MASLHACESGELFLEHFSVLKILNGNVISYKDWIACMIFFPLFILTWIRILLAELCAPGPDPQLFR